MSDESVRQEVTFDPPTAREIDLAAIMAKRRERAATEDQERAVTMARPIEADGCRQATAAQKLEALGLTVEDIREVLGSPSPAARDTTEGE